MSRTFRLPRRLSLWTLTIALMSAATSWGQADDPKARPETKGSPAIVDDAGMFNPMIVREASEKLESLERERHVPARIQTVETLKGSTIDELAPRLAQRWGRQGVFVLLADKESKLLVLVSRRFEKALPKARTEAAIRDAFLAEFKKKNIDAGLTRGVEAIDKAIGSAPAGSIAEAAVDSSPLVARNQVKLTLAGARRILAGAEAKAAATGRKMNIAVVDDGGHLLAFARMDGARPASAATATTKAVSAATFRQPTGPLPAGSDKPDVVLNISLQNAAALHGGSITSLLGGVPVVVDGQIIGAIGVAGGTGEQDAEVAKAGAAAFQDEVKSGSAPEERH